MTSLVNGSAQNSQGVTERKVATQWLVLVSPGCREAHPFIVQRPGSKKIIGRFASLFCAAQTALQPWNGLLFRGGRAILASEVIDERNGAVYQSPDLKMVELGSVVPLKFVLSAGGIRVGRQQGQDEANEIYGAA